jgi:hypothetical protein
MQTIHLAGFYLASLALTLGCTQPSPKNGTSEMDVDDEAFRKSIEDFQNRKIYTSLDIETLQSIADDDLEQAVVDYVCEKIENAGEERIAIAALSDGNRALWHTWVLDGEVNNGGFNQYYWNTNGLFSEQAVEAFRFFGATNHATLMQKANTVRAEEEIAMKKYRDENTLVSFSASYDESKLGPIDDEYYSLDEVLSALRIAKIRQSPELFIGD